MLRGFRDFILRGNVVDMAVGIIIGAAFNGIVNALVAGIINPLIASTIHKPDFGSVMLTINGGQIKVGEVLNAGISFLIIAATVYFGIVMPMHFFMNKIRKEGPPPAPNTKTCTECMSEIPLPAKRCAHCGQPQPVPQQADQERQPVGQPAD